MIRFLCALGLLLSSFSAAAGAARASDYRVSPERRAFRTRFDPASRVWIGTIGSASGASGVFAASSELAGGVAFRTRDADAPAGRVIWQVDHRMLTGFVAPYATSSGRVPALDVVLYSISLHRHDPSPRLVLPTSPPIALPFPFDTGFELELARAWAPRRVMGDGFARLGVARATTFIDPWRSARAGRSLELGIGVRYDIDLHGALFAGTDFERRPLAATRVVHRLAPMTATSVRFRYQTDDGLASLDARAELVPHWASVGGWAVSASLSAVFERTLLAVNDVPISLFALGEMRTVPGTEGVPSITYARIGTGLLVGYSLR